MFNDEISAAFQVNRFPEGNLDLFGNVELIKNRCASGVELNDVFLLRGNAADIVPYLLEHLFRIHHNAVEGRIQHIAQQGGGLAHLTHHFLGSFCSFKFCGQLFPLLGKMRHVFMKLLHRFAFGQCAHNHSKIFRLYAFHQPAQPFSFFG